MVDTNQTDVDGELLGYVLASTYRKQVLERLANGDALPSMIAEDTGLNMAHVSRALTGFRERDVVELLVPEDTRKGRLYGLTETGEAAAERVLEVSGNAD